MSGIFRGTTRDKFAAVFCWLSGPSCSQGEDPGFNRHCHLLLCSKVRSTSMCDGVHADTVCNAQSELHGIHACGLHGLRGRTP